MKQLNFNKDWEFTLDHDLDAFSLYGFRKYSDAMGAPARFYEHNNWQKIDLPHDWAVALPKDLALDMTYSARNKSRYHAEMSELHSEKEEVFNIGWYRKSFTLPEAYADKRLFLEFEGVFRNADFFVNGVYMDHHNSGYTGFLFEITDHVHAGETNSVAVRVDAEQPEGWWYEGAGIYRNVNLLVGEPIYFKPYETVIRATTEGDVSASAILVNDTEKEISTEVLWQIRDPSGAVVAEKATTATLAPFHEAGITAALKIASPLLWDVDSPNLYTLTVSAIDEVSETFGLRSIYFDPDKGFFLNGRPLKINGACVHQDFGGVGVALSDNLNYYKIRKLKEMGANAYRASHNAPTPALLRACDELGMLVMDETRCFGTSPEALRQLTHLVKRDRNHPSVFLWSIGNEEFTVQSQVWSKKLAEKVCRIIKELDPTRPTTYGGSNGVDFTGANSAVDVRGVNYIRNAKMIDQYHKDHPTQPVVGSEETSFLNMRGGKRTDFARGELSCNGDTTTPWGATPKGWLKFYDKRPWFSGGFMWTGFDYRGEPNPFAFTNPSSVWGPIDLCGMEKPTFYYHKAWWLDEPVLKIAPHWNFRKGEKVEITTFTNCEEVTLYINGKSCGTKKVERFDTPIFEVIFEPGVIVAEGMRNGKLYRDEIRTAGKPAAIRTVPVLPCLKEGDIGIVELQAIDKDGVLCPTASNAVELSLKNGRIVGVGNGDPADLYPEQFADGEEARYIRTFVTEDDIYYVPPKQPNTHTIWKGERHWVVEREEIAAPFEDDYRFVPKHVDLEANKKQRTFVARFDDAAEFEYIEFERLHGAATVYLNGVEIGNNRQGLPRQTFNKNNRPYRFCCKFKKGENELKIVTTLTESTRNGMSGYVKLGKRVPAGWSVHLYYGRARVFLKADDLTALSARLIKK